VNNNETERGRVLFYFVSRLILDLNFGLCDVWKMLNARSEELELITRMTDFLAYFAALRNVGDENFGCWKAAMRLWLVECVFLRGIIAVESLPAYVAVSAKLSLCGRQENAVSR
jgi:hypothetical protein